MSTAIRTRKRREPGWVDAAIKVLESLSVNGRSAEIDLPEILKQISLLKFKTIKGSIDERDSLRRSLEQAHDTFYISDNEKFGLLKFKPKSDPVQGGPKQPKVKEKRGRGHPGGANRTHMLNTATMCTETANNAQMSYKMKGKKKKDSAGDLRQRKFSTEDLFAPESPLIGINLKDYINEDIFNQLPVNNKWELMKMLPACDIDIDASGMPTTTRDSLNNEFFTRALTAFPERITDGEFTTAMKARINIESSRRRIDPWKEKFFEAYWGQLSGKRPPPEGEKTAAKLDELVKMSQPPVQSRNSPNPRNSVRNGKNEVKSEPRIKAEPVKEDNLYSAKLPSITQMQETIIQPWEAMQAVKTLSSPEVQESRGIPVRVIQTVKLKPGIRVSIDNVKPLKNVAPCSSVSVSPAGSSLVSSDSPASRGPSTSPSSLPATGPVPVPTSPMAIPFATALKTTSQSESAHSPPAAIRVQTPETTGRSADKPPGLMTINLPPIPVIHPSPYASSSSSPSQPMVGQKRTRTLADIRAEVAQKKQRPSVITYCQPRQQPMPVRVIKSVQKAVPNDRVLILTPVKSLGQSGSSKPMYQMVTGQKPHRTAFQSSSMTTSVIQTLQLQRQPTSQSGSSTSASQTYVIKMNPNRLTEQSGGSRRPHYSGGVIQTPSFGANRSPSHDACSNDPYAQCTSCHKLYRLEQVKKINNEFRCVHCYKS